MLEPLKAKWIAALRSSQYQQGCGRLRSTKNKYCCLGVLCDVIDQTYWKLDTNTHSYSWIGSTNTPPTYILSTQQAHHLVNMNDKKCNNFEEIANYIEENM